MSQAHDTESDTERADGEPTPEDDPEAEESPEIEEELVAEELRIDGICGVY